MKINRRLYHSSGITCLALLLTVSVLGQDGNTQELQDKFTQYQLKTLQEKMFVHTDKAFYLCGEVIWFRLYTVDESFNRPLDISKVGYIEIISEEQKPVMQAKIGLQNGSGNGSFIIPSSLASGSYKLRAYTSRMKNFSAGFYFEQPLTIINTLKSPTQKTTAPSPAYHVNFFAEGGNMVDGINSRIAFKITDAWGNGIDGSGAVTNGKDTLTRINTLHAGMGSFLLTPEKGTQYQAVLQVNGTSIVQNLPAVYDQGYAMQATDNNAGDQLIVTVTGTSQFNNLPVYLFVHTRNLVKEVLRAQLSGNKAVFQVNKQKMGEGMSHLTVFNSARQPVCERLYFKRPSAKLKIDIQTDKPEYASRDKISINLKTSDKLLQPQIADMSMAVVMIDSLQTLQFTDIQNWLLLQSELTGSIENPGYYLTDSTTAGNDALNNLLLTQGWRRFKWEDVLARKTPTFEFITENEGPVLNGVLTDKRTGAVQKNILATLTVPGENFELRSATSKSDGSIRFNLNDFYSTNEIILQTVNAADSNIKITMANPFSESFSTAAFPRFNLLEKWKDQLLYRSINTQADNAYLVEKKRQAFTAPVIDTNVFYGKSEKMYYLDDYTRFITMDEVMREFVVDVRVRKQSDGYQFRVVNGVYKTLFDQDPLVLIDGLPVSKLDKLMALDPLKFKRIDVATHRHYLGPLISDGIVSFKSYQGDLGGYELDPNSVVIAYDGLQRQREFYAPLYETAEQKQTRLPDLRNVLYWMPDIKTAEDGKQTVSFYTSDLKSNFAVIVQGLTANGLSGSNVTTFTVK